MLEDFKEYLTDKSDNTKRIYMQQVEKFLEWLKERYNQDDPARVIELDVGEYKKYLQNVTYKKPIVKDGIKQYNDVKLSSASIAQHMFAVRKYCEFLNEKGYTKTDVSKNLKIKKETKNTRPKTLDRNEFNSFRREIHLTDNPLYIAMIELLMATGMRVSELVSLTLEDIKLSDKKGSVSIVHGKGDKPRTIPLNNDARKALMDYLKVRKHTESNQLFIGQRGSMSADGVRKLINRYAKKAGIDKKVTPHMFRHQLATELIRNKHKDLVLVKDILGHSNINTLYIYSKSSEEEQAEALENLYE